MRIFKLNAFSKQYYKNFLPLLAPRLQRKDLLPKSKASECKSVWTARREAPRLLTYLLQETTPVLLFILLSA